MPEIDQILAEVGVDTSDVRATYHAIMSNLASRVKALEELLSAQAHVVVASEDKPAEQVPENG